MSDEDREKWDAKWSVRLAGPGDAPAWLAEIAGELPEEGAALDVAAGAGRIGLWAARRGLAATLVDVSPVGLALAQKVAARDGLEVQTIERDLEHESLPDGPFALVTCFGYEQAALWPTMVAALAPGGVLIAEGATRTNLERHDHPSARYCVEPGELRARAESLELQIVAWAEGWLGGRHVSRLVARRAL